MTKRVCEYSDLVLKYQALKQICSMGAKKSSSPGGAIIQTNKRRKREQRTKVSEGPQFEVTGTHLVILVGALFTLAWFAGLLPDP